MEQYDYSGELIAKWSQMGRLVGVADTNQVTVAQRLEAAFRRSLGQHGDISALDKEMSSLQREGFFGLPPAPRSMNSIGTGNKICECRIGNRSRNSTNKAKKR